MTVDQSSYLIKLLSRFDVPFGVERSLKISRRKWMPGRLLLSINKQALGARPADELFTLLSELQCPRPACDQLLEHLQDAGIIHFGYERDGPRLLYKCYLEFSGQYRRAPQRDDSHDGVLVHLAGKWEPGASSVTFSHYHGFKGLKCIDVLARIRDEIYAGRKDSVPLDTLSAISAAADKGTADEVMLMLVTEPGNDRLSFDVNIYDWEYTVADIRAHIERMLSAFDIPVEISRHYLDSHGADTAGHISGGYDRSGNEFFTLYHGVEEIVP